MTLEAPKVRPATAADLDELSALGATLARLHHELDERRFLFTSDLEAGYRSWFSSELSRRNAYLGVVDDEQGALAGYAYGRLAGRNWADLLDAHAALVDLYVRDAARRRGVGRALVLSFCAWAKGRGAPRVVLKTAARNPGAQALFASLGFRPTLIEMTREIDEDEPR